MRNQSMLAMLITVGGILCFSAAMLLFTAERRLPPAYAQDNQPTDQTASVTVESSPTLTPTVTVPATATPTPTGTPLPVYFPLLSNPRVPTNLELVSADAQLPARVGAGTSIVTTLADPRGPLFNYPLFFSTTSGTLDFLEARTDPQGRATINLSLDANTIGQINKASSTVTITGNSTGITNTTTVLVNTLPCNDIEDNDVPETASELTALNAACLGAVDDDGEVNELLQGDFYRFRLDQPAALRLALRGMPPGANFDLQLLRAPVADDICMSLAPFPFDRCAASSRISNSDEVTTSPTLPVGEYLLWIEVKEKADVQEGVVINTYVLSVLTEPAR